MVGLLYGGVVKGVMLRWGVMSLVVLALWRGLARPAQRPPRPALLVGMTFAALLFATARLPALVTSGAPIAGRS